MADPINAINGSKVDYTKWKKMTAEEIIKEEGKGEEIPAEILTWAQQMAAFSKIPDNVTYEQVDGDIGLEALEALNLEDPANPTTDNAVAPVETETDDAVGDVVQIEVGALLVGAIRNNHSESFSKGDEKGYFEYGGSTIILLVENDVVDIDNDILENSKKGIETKVTIGEKIGVVKGV